MFAITIGWEMACMCRDRGVYRIMIGRPEEKKSIKRPRRRWEDNIERDLEELSCEESIWSELGLSV